ncbi:MAG: potassium-transporting ATPase subunit KdpA [Hydrogenobaculum sp.]|nr:MAG: potassium-transporting ATPase subunit KdpA [Hydrogenobaculum sp.]
MNVFLDIFSFALFFGILTVVSPFLGKYMADVYEGNIYKFLKPIRYLENAIYKILGIDESKEMNWKEYLYALLSFNFLGFLILFLTLLFQKYLPLNQYNIPNMSWDLAFNTAASFVTNTNWQAYAGETQATYFSQMTGLALQNFLSAASGIVVALVLIRAFARKNTVYLGNFFVDFTRTILYVLLPLSFFSALFLVSQGVIQNFSHYKSAELLEAFKNGKDIITHQILPMGPVASQEAIKLLGTNGGGFFNANSAHPFENPTPLSNVFEAFIIILIPASLVFTFGYMIKDKRQGWFLYSVMLFVLLLMMGIGYYFEYYGNPIVKKLGVEGPYLIGKELRFGMGGTMLFSSITTAVSCGAVDGMFDSFTPLGGLVPMSLISLGEIIFGGVGSGLYGMLAMIIIAVFVAGLMIGRTPEYLNKKIEAKEMWSSVIITLVAGVTSLLLTTLALYTKWGLSSISNPGPHGLSEVLYAYISASNNNGSAFAGLNANTVFYNITTGLAMLIGRFVPIVAVFYMASSLSLKKHIPPSPGTLPTHTLVFGVWVVFIIIVVGALTFLPAFSLGPILEHMLMLKGVTL